MKNEIKRIGVLVLCNDPDCSAMYTGMPEKPDDLLPCGHKMATATFDGSSFKSIMMNRNDLDEMKKDVADIKLFLY